MAALPPDIIIDIFAKLPAKTLCRFKCLSKSFMALITYPGFVKMHQIQNQPQALVVPGGDNNTLLIVDLDSKITRVHHLDIPIIKSSYRSLWIHSSCNGLLCLSVKDETANTVCFIYNCSTREFMRIPNYEPFNKEHPVVGLGYAESIDEYKVVGVSNSYIDDTVKIGVFSLSNNSWKSFTANFFYFEESCPSILNGSIHFGFCKLNSENPIMIAAFDLEEEKFKFLALPHYDFGFHSVFYYYFSVIGGCLCLSPCAMWRTNEFWIMKEYGVTESWTRISLANTILYFQPLCSMKDSSFILSVLNDKFVFFDLKDGTYKDLVIDGYEKNPMVYSMAVYAESMISPNGKTNFLSEGALDFEFRAGAGAV